MKDKKVLLRTINLKMYFPMKQGRFLKANDDISLDIYEDETFGLVGESGCGKSTFGRTILQLYEQTDGKTMYYGITLDEMAPAYVKETLENLSKRKQEIFELRDKQNEALKVLSKLTGMEYEQGKSYELDIDEEGENAQALFEALQAAQETRSRYKMALLNVTQLIGGLLVADNMEEVAKLYIKKYGLVRGYQRANDRAVALGYQKDAQCFDLRQRKAVGKDTGSVQRKIDQLEKDIGAAEAEKKNIQNEIRTLQTEIEQLRKRNSEKESFDYWDKNLDDGIDLARLNKEEMRRIRRDLQLIFQDPYSSLNPRMTVGQIIGEGMIAHGMFRKNNAHMQEKVMQVMEECGLAPYMLHRYPHQFSGGQRQRIGIARSLALRPSFVVCDEAVSALDVSIQSQILNLLLELKEKDNLTYMFISHDLSVIKYISDRIGVMYLGNIVEMAKTEDLFGNYQHPYTEALLQAIPTTDPDAKIDDTDLLEGDIPSPVNPPKGCKFHTRCKYASKVCREVVPELFEVEPDHFVACHHMLRDKGKQGA